MDVDLIRDRLLPGEKLLWSGGPQRGILFTASDAFLIPFSVMWGGFAIFWEASVLSTKAPDFFGLWGIPFVLVGLYLIVGRFFVDAWIRGGLVYAVTSQRILIARPSPIARFTALNLNQLPAVSLKERNNGRGDIVFGDSVSVFGRRGFSGWSPALDPTPRFLGIENVKVVFDLIQRQLQVKPA